MMWHHSVRHLGRHEPIGAKQLDRPVKQPLLDAVVETGLGDGEDMKKKIVEWRVGGEVQRGRAASNHKFNSASNRLTDKWSNQPQKKGGRAALQQQMAARAAQGVALREAMQAAAAKAMVDSAVLAAQRQRGEYVERCKMRGFKCPLAAAAARALASRAGS